MSFLNIEALYIISSEKSVKTCGIYRVMAKEGNIE